MMSIKSKFEKVLKEKYLLLFFLFWVIVFVVLSFFRDSRLDENIYLGEAVLISDLLKEGIWVGNNSVGLHGFLSKLLLGIIFIFTGPSVFIATLLNIVFGVLSGFVFYKILNKYFKLPVVWSIIGVTLLFCSYQFITYIPTFYRDIQALLFVLLAIDSVLENKNKWKIGIFLLLLLDAKEHVFFTVAPAFLIWAGVNASWSAKNKKFHWIKNFILNCVYFFLPSLAWLILMFSTSLIPLNMYNANILGLLDIGFTKLSNGFRIDVATFNQDLPYNEGVVKVIDVDAGTIHGIILKYIGKIFYPRTFSFLSIPFLIIIPSVYFMFSNFKLWMRSHNNKIIISLSVIVFLLIYIFRASMGRYILPVSPLFFLFMILFLKDINKDIKKNKLVIVAAILFSAIGMYFEYSYLVVKITITLIGFLLLLLSMLSKDKKANLLNIMLILVISIFYFGTSIFASFRHGQIGNYLTYGYNRECKEITNLVDIEDSVWIYDLNWDRLPFIFRHEDVQKPEWRWSLMHWIPKKGMLIEGPELKTFNFSCKSWDKFKNRVYKNNIEKLVFVDLQKVSESEIGKFEDKCEFDNNDSWLELESKVKMKNKLVYVYRVL